MGMWCSGGVVLWGCGVVGVLCCIVGVLCSGGVV